MSSLATSNTWISPPDLPEQALRYFDNLAMSIHFRGFFFSLHVSTSTNSR